jgi:stress response protein YsnF
VVPVNSIYPDMVDNVTERMLTAVPSRHGCDLDTLRECIEAIQTVTQVTLACADARLVEQVVDELTNHAEQVLVSTQVVPVERVRLIKRVVTEQTVVTGQVRSEHVDVDITAPPASPTP